MGVPLPGIAAEIRDGQIAIDAASPNPTQQRFEKMISGMYLGELCRLSVLAPEVLPAFSDEFKSSLQSTFGERMSLPTSLMSAIESDSSPRLAAAAEAPRPHQYQSSCA